jgi:hypothetical protein
VAAQLTEVLSLGIDFDIVVPHPVPNPLPPEQTSEATYMQRIADEVLPLVRAALA